MSGKKAKLERKQAEQQKQVRVSAKITVPPEKLAPVVANLNTLRISETPDKVKEDIINQINNLIHESFHVGMRVGRQTLLKEIEANKGLVQKASTGLILPAHLAAERQKPKKGNGDDSKG